MRPKARAQLGLGITVDEEVDVQRIPGTSLRLPPSAFSLSVPDSVGLCLGQVLFW